MGAFYFDQSRPVRMLLIPHNPPIQVPAGGGSFDYTIQICNIDRMQHQVLVWCDATLPDGSSRGPLCGPARITLEPDQTLSKTRAQTVPGAAPMGSYLYNAYAVVGQDTSVDNFAFTKMGAVGRWGQGTQGWTNTGEPITNVVGARHASPLQGQATLSGAVDAPTKYALYTCSPNPFNAATTIRFDLPVAGYVKLQVFDISGRAVGASGSGTTPSTALADGWREAGTHEVTFDAGDLPSGVYFCRIQTGDFEAVQKMVLLK